MSWYGGDQCHKHQDPVNEIRINYYYFLFAFFWENDSGVLDKHSLRSKKKNALNNDLSMNCSIDQYIKK